MTRISYIVEVSTGPYFQNTEQMREETAKHLEELLREEKPHWNPTVILFGHTED